MKKFEYWGSILTLFQIFVPCYSYDTVSQKERERIKKRIRLKIHVMSGPMKGIILYVSGYDYVYESCSAVLDYGCGNDHGPAGWECADILPDDLDKEQLVVKVYRKKKRPKRTAVIRKLKKRYRNRS